MIPFPVYHNAHVLAFLAHHAATRAPINSYAFPLTSLSDREFTTKPRQHVVIDQTGARLRGIRT